MSSLKSLWITLTAFTTGSIAPLVDSSRDDILFYTQMFAFFVTITAGLITIYKKSKGK